SRIGIEQGLVGLGLWIAFLGWFFMRTAIYRGPSVGLHYSLTAFYLLLMWGFAWLGAGMLTSIPCTAMLLFQMGWLGRCACERPDSKAFKGASHKSFQYAGTWDGATRLGSQRKK